MSLIVGQGTAFEEPLIGGAGLVVALQHARSKTFLRYHLSDRDVEVEPVSPPIHVFGVAQIAPTPLLELPLPGFLQFQDDACRQVGNVRAHQRLERFAHVGGGDALEVEPGNERINRGGATQVARQDGRAELHVVRGILARPIAQTWLPHIQRTGAGQDRPFRQVAVTNYPVVIVFIAEAVKAGEHIRNLYLQSSLKELSGAFPDHFIER